MMIHWAMARLQKGSTLDRGKYKNRRFMQHPILKAIKKHYLDKTHLSASLFVFWHH